MRKKMILFTLILGFVCMCIPLTLIGGSLAYFNLRPQPKETSETLFNGVTYERQVLQSPRPMVIHVVEVDLRAEGIDLLVTPGDPEEELPLEARTTSQYLREFDLQLAVNGDGFEPWRSNTILDYYPRAGDRVAPTGFAASGGTIYSPETKGEPILYFSPTERARFYTPIGKINNAVSGTLMLVHQGESVVGQDGNQPNADIPEPRTVLALDKSGRHLIIVVVDGRQPGYSQGATLDELAQIALDHGANFAMNMDGGGSTTLVVENRLGFPKTLNSPVNHGIPGWQRPVGNHLGVYATGMD